MIVVGYLFVRIFYYLSISNYFFKTIDDHRLTNSSQIIKKMMNYVHTHDVTQINKKNVSKILSIIPDFFFQQREEYPKQLMIKTSINNQNRLLNVC
jgi:hypothetical protein